MKRFVIAIIETDERASLAECASDEARADSKSDSTSPQHAALLKPLRPNAAAGRQSQVEETQLDRT
eukprot:CAMPEP_0180519316 /NCGR_PEP_ID=MMETSP1036_2-20121128/55615_1 /TAXON_ID=632150 /ORGANISM="Azadinium spinosum, Strain 3D9" /LENGTH=65 /DNA_ID=CAMNT_0022531631 /DNA_START=53 /DNA_END=247 /DNA_ORIENTATION=+